MALGTVMVFSACKKNNVTEPQASTTSASGEDLIAAANKVAIYVSAADTAAAVNNLYYMEQHRTIYSRKIHTIPVRKMVMVFIIMWLPMNYTS